ncbi:MAG: type II secretion system secretin GspD [Thermodesulfobacteriota bacterium]
MRRVVFLLLCLALGSPGQAQERDPFTPSDRNGHPPHALPPGEENAAPKPPPGASDNVVAMNFQDVDIPVLARFISEITGKNFIIDEKVRGKVTIISPTKVHADEAYAVFQSVLQVKGFTTVPSGGAIKVVPSREAKQAGLPMLYNGSLAAAGDEFITRLAPLRHVTAAEMAAVLQPMVSSDGLLIPYTPTNTLIITDSALNIRRLLGIVEELDVEGQERITEVIPLKHAFAADLAAKLEHITKEHSANEGTPPPQRVRTVTAAGGPVPAVGGGIRPVRVLPDERTNSLIVVAGPLELKTIRRVVARLDVPLPPGTSKINVVPLKYANAEEMLPILADLIGARAAGTSGGNPSIRAPRRDRRARREDRSRPQSGRFEFTPGAHRQSVSATPESSLPPQGAVGTAPEFNGEMQITADPATNSLIVSASPQDFATLRAVIEQLDVRRRQVYVEAIILEVSVDRARELGIELQGSFSIEGEGVALGRATFKDLNRALTNPTSLSGLLLAAASNKTIELPDGTRIPAQIALLRAAQSSTDINVLSAPTLLTTDNEEAEILVGQNVPFIASRATDSTDLDNLFATVQREDVGIRLRLTPQISEGDTVRLDIYEEVSAIVPTPPSVGDPNLVGPTTSVRSASTTVVVKSGQTVVIGGLISDNITRQRSTVPYLGELPVLGNLFRSDVDSANKINLLIFLTPHIVRSDTEIAARSVEEREQFRGFLKENRAPARWQRQLDRPSFAPPAERQTGGVLLPAVEGSR